MGTVEQTTAVSAGGRHEAGRVGEGATRARWRIAERIISVTIGGTALSAAIYLGVTGPMVSPVTAGATQSQAAASTGSAATTDPGTDPTGADDGRGGGRGGGHGRAGDGRHR